MFDDGPPNYKHYLKRFIGRLWKSRVSPDNRCLILIYHSVDGGPISTSLESFRAQMDWLAGHASVISLDALLNKNKNDKRDGRLVVALTFDDGYRSLFDTVAPILDEHGFTATVYLNVAEINDEIHTNSQSEQGHYPEEQFMVWSEVEQLHRNGWTIGSHGVHHVDLCLCDDNVLRQQVCESKNSIEVRLGIDCEHFSYTWGHYNNFVKTAVKSAGYSSAVSCVHAPVTSVCDPYTLPRLDIRREYSLEDFENILQGGWDYLCWVPHLKKMMSSRRHIA